MSAPKVCPHGCRYYNDGWHAENCPGVSVGPQAVFLQEPEYQRERQADDRERTYEEFEWPLISYPERGISE
jgi:hypothetical protein